MELELQNSWVRQVALFGLIYLGVNAAGASPLSLEYYLFNPDIIANNLTVIGLLD